MKGSLVENSERRLTRKDTSSFSSRVLRGDDVTDLGSDNCQVPPIPDSIFELGDGKHVPADAHFNGILGMIRTTQSGMSLFYTRKGHIGIAKETVRPGDIVFLVPGRQVPMLMRDALVGVLE